jgi:hypothetical protein
MIDGQEIVDGDDRHVVSLCRRPKYHPPDATEAVDAEVDHAAGSLSFTGWPRGRFRRDDVARACSFAAVT